MRCIVYSVLVIFLFTNLTGALTSEDPGNGGLEETPYQADSMRPRVDGGMADPMFLAPKAFTENLGQVEEHVRFYDQGGGLWFTDDGVWFDIPDDVGVGGVILKMEFDDCNDVEPVGVVDTGWYSNYFFGNVTEKWRTEVSNWREIWYYDLWDGIDLRFYTNEKGLKYDLIVHPRGDVGIIQIDYLGAVGLEAVGTDGIIIQTVGGNLFDGDLFIYQMGADGPEKVEGSFSLLGPSEYGFRITGDVRPDVDLIIDPQVFSTLLGGTGNDYCNGIAFDSTGNIYITGFCQTGGFPTTPGSYDTTHNGDDDIYISKFDQTASNLVYSTFIGGSDEEKASDIAVDSNGCAYIAGDTFSSSFPATSGAYDTAFSSGNMYVLKLGASGSSISYSTFMGASFYDDPVAIEVDSAGSAYVLLETLGGSFPTTVGAYDTTYNSQGDMAVVKLNPAGSQLLYSTFLGGSSGEYNGDIAVDGSGNAYITADTNSADFPTTSGAFDTSSQSGRDGIACKLNPSGSSLMYSTYLGGTSHDYSFAIDVDSSGNALVGGRSLSSDFPTTSGVYSSSYIGSCDCTLVKLNSAGTGLIFSTYFGGNSWDEAFGVAYDSSGNVIVVGESTSNNLPITSGAHDSTTASDEGFVTKLNPSGSNVLYSSYIGGTGQDGARSVDVDEGGNIYIGGQAGSSDFPTTSGAYQTGFSGGTEAFACKISYGSIFNITSASLLMDDTPTSSAYARYGPYDLRTVILNTALNPDISDVTVSLDPNGNDIQLKWNRSSDQFTELSDPDDRISLGDTSSATNIGKSWIVSFNLTFNWAYNDETPQDIKVYATDSGKKPAWLNKTALFSVENDLDFDGTLAVLGSDDRTLAEDDLVSGGETLNCTGLTVVYQGTTDVYPPPKEYDISVWGETGEPLIDSPGEGVEMGLDITAPWESYDSGYTYTFNISGIPPESDATDVTFTLGVDADNVTFTDPTPVNATWQTDTIVDVGVTITDWGGSIVDGDSVRERHSIDNGDTWSGWSDVPVASSAVIDPMVTVSLEDGTGNLVQWEASDTIGNGPSESPEFQVLVDAVEVEFLDPYPGPDYISSTESVMAGINITDLTSGVDASTIEYSISTNGGISWGDWTVVMGYDDGPLVQTGVTTTFVNGADNLIRWRAYDIAGNGPTESDEYPVNVDLCMAYSIDTALVSPADGAVLTTASADLSWTLVADDNPCGSVVEYDVFLDNVNPPVALLKTGYMDTSVRIDNLQDKQTYYWTVTPVRGSQIGSCVSGVWSFTYDSEAYVPEVTLISPADGATLNTDSIQLTWEALDVAGGDGWTYDIILDTVNPPSLARFTDLKDTSAVFIDMVDKVTYYWTVKPCNGTATGNCNSGVWSFTYDKDAVVPEVILVSPADGDMLADDSVRLEWAPVGDSTGWKYEIYLDENDPPSTLKNGGYTQTSVTIGGLEDGTTYHWTVVPISSEGVYGIFGATVWSFTVDLSAVSGECGIDIYDVPDISLNTGDTYSLEVNFTNTGNVMDRYVFNVTSATLNVQLMQGSIGEITLAPDNTKQIYLSISVGPNTMLGAHSVTIKGTSKVAEDASSDVSEEVTFTVYVTKRSDQTTDPGSQSGGNMMMYLIVVIVVVAIVIVLLLVLRKRKSKEGESRGDVHEGTAIAIDIVKPGGEKRTVKATPAGIMDVQANLKAADGSLVPLTTPLVPAGGALAGGPEPISLDRLLPKAGGTVDKAGDDGKPSGPFKPGTIVQPGMKAKGPMITTKPMPSTITTPTGAQKKDTSGGDLDFKKPDIAQFLTDKTSPDKAEVYHSDSGGVWTPDLATKRTTQESAGAMEILPKLKKMLDEGVITQEEFEVSKKRLLRKI